MLGAIFIKSKHIQWFCQRFHTFRPNFHRFCPDFKSFCPDFHKIKNFGGEVATPALPPSTPVGKTIAYTLSLATIFIYRLKLNFLNKLSGCFPLNTYCWQFQDSGVGNLRPLGQMQPI